MILVLAAFVGSSKYSVIGSIRIGTSMIAYELVLTCCILIMCVSNGSFDLIGTQQQELPLTLPVFMVIFFIAILAETQRVPFDLAEVESEIVAGFTTELIGILFSIIVIAEYASVVI